MNLKITKFRGNSEITSFDEFRFFTGITDTGLLNTVFGGCTSLKELTVPEGITRLGYDCFSGLTSLEKVNIPNSLVYIDNANVFLNCNLKSFEAYGPLEYIGGSTFRNNKNLVSCIIPNAVITLLENNLFQGCGSLESFDIPETVTSIGGACFNGCSTLKHLVIPERVTRIRYAAFGGCLSMEYFILLSVTPPALENQDAFSNTNNCPIYVPATSVSAYKTATNWSNYASRIQAIPD